jgi:hypothetical protein
MSAEEDVPLEKWEVEDLIAFRVGENWGEWFRDISPNLKLFLSLVFLDSVRRYFYFIFLLDLLP